VAHHIYHTRGLILGSVPTGEANRFYKIFTEELGLVGATAQAIREGKSKLRYGLQDFSWVFVDLVRGKEVWRITSSREEESTSTIKSDPLVLKVFARACSLVLRLVHGEERDDVLFQELVSLSRFLEQGGAPEKLLPACEALVALRVLALLGYLEASPYEEFLKGGDWSQEILVALERQYEKAVTDINSALRESHL
jgi:DNA repair protein RecO